MRYIKNLALLVAFVCLCGFGGSGGGGGGGGGGGILITSGAGEFGAGTSQSSAVLTGVGVNPTLSSNLQQPVMFVGVGAPKTFSSATTTGTINSPVGVANGDQELVYIQIANATASAFVPPAGWSAVTNCNTQGNTVTGQVFSHTASSEGATIAAFTWTGSSTGEASALAYRNAGVDVCAASNAAASTTFSTSGITAAATSDRVVTIGGQPSAGGYIAPTNILTAPKAGYTFDDSYVSNTSYGVSIGSYPITSTTVPGFAWTSGTSQPWVGFQIGLSYVTSTTAGPPGALTYNEFGSAYLNSLTLGAGMTIGNGAAGATVTQYSLIMPNAQVSGSKGGIGSIDSNGIVRTMLSVTSTGLGLTVGDAAAVNGSGFNTTIAGPLQIQADNLVSSMPRMPIAFSIAQTSISTGVNLACTKTVKAITIENDEGSWSIGASCNGQVIRVYDCGTSAPANAGCSGGTQLTTNTYSATAGTVTDGTISQSSVAAGHYMCAQIQASGSCTTMYGQETLMARPQ